MPDIAASVGCDGNDAVNAEVDIFLTKEWNSCSRRQLCTDCDCIKAVEPLRRISQLDCIKSNVGFRQQGQAKVHGKAGAVTDR